MQKAISLANIISKKLDNDHTELLDEYNYKYVFDPIFELPLKHKEINTLICAIIYSYCPESNKPDLNQDGQTINENILKGLGADLKNPIYWEFIRHENKKIKEALGNFFDTIISWEYITARQEMDYHATYIRAAEDESEFSKLDADKKYKARAEIGRLKKEAINHRNTAELLIEKIRKDHMITDERVKQDFGVSFIDETIKRNNLSWREFIVYDYDPLKNKNHIFMLKQKSPE